VVADLGARGRCRARPAGWTGLLGEAAEQGAERPALRSSGPSMVRRQQHLGADRRARASSTRRAVPVGNDPPGSRRAWTPTRSSNFSAVSSSSTSDSRWRALEADASRCRGPRASRTVRGLEGPGQSRRPGDGDRGGDVAPIDVHLAVIRTLQTAHDVNSVFLPAPFGPISPVTTPAWTRSGDVESGHAAEAHGTEFTSSASSDSGWHRELS